MAHQDIRQTRSLGKKNAPFHVWTADDFGSKQQVSAKRRALNTSACQRCRYRKAKCIVSPSPSQSSTTASRLPCQLCKRLNAECVWDTIDKRRRRRHQGAVSNGSPPPTIQNTPGDGNLTNEDPAGLPDGDYSQLPELGQDDSSNARNISNIQSTQSQASPCPNADLNLSSAAETPFWDSSGLDLGSIYIPQELVGNSRPEFSFELPRDWSPGLQDFTLGLDLIDQGFAECTPGQIQQISDTHMPTGDSSMPKSRIIRLRCYRRLGPTAVVPGVRRLFVAVEPYSSPPGHHGRDGQRTESSPGDLSIATPHSTLSAYNDLFDAQAQRPHSSILSIILDVFFDHFGGHFPFLQRRVLNGHVQTGEASSFLLNAISALTTRFCSLDGPLAVLKCRFKSKWRQGAPFLAKAKEQLVSLLSIPASDVLAGLIIMSWVEFGDNNEAGMWMFSGMAIRMAQDLGYHRRLEAVDDPAEVFRNFSSTSDGLVLTDEQSALHQHKSQLVLFWSAFILDVYVSLVTGRPTTLQRNEIDAPIPTKEDMNVTQLEWDTSDPMRNIIFPEVVGFMLHFSESLKTLNQMTTMSTACLEGEGNDYPSPLKEFSQTRARLLGRYQSLPRQLAFSVETYRRSLASNQGGLFITLHLFFYTFTILLSSKDPRSTKCGLHNNSEDSIQPVRGQMEEQQNVEISRMACQKMAHILTVADIVQKMGYLATPFTYHCFFVAASSILQEVNVAQGLFCDSFMSSTTENDFDLFNDKLREQSEYFRAISSAFSTLAQQKRLSTGEDGGHSTGDEEGDNSLGRVIEDLGIVTRYSIR